MKIASRLALSASFAALMAMAPLSAAQADQMVVLASSSPAISEGGMVESDQTLTLAAGENVTLLSMGGQTVKLSGPFNGVPTAQKASAGGNSKAMAAISAMFKSQKKSTASLGAVRAANVEAAEAKVPDPWLVSVENSGNRCLRSGKPVLWRASAGQSDFKLQSAGALKKKIEGPWPAGKSRITMPDNFFVDGKTYEAILDGRTVEITTHMLPATLNYANPAEVASEMAQRNCVNQAMALLNSLQ